MKTNDLAQDNRTPARYAGGRSLIKPVRTETIGDAIQAVYRCHAPICTHGLWWTNIGFASHPSTPHSQPIDAPQANLDAQQAIAEHDAK